MTIINKVSAKSVMPGVTAIPDVVDAPTIGSATAGIESATVTYTAAATGGAATSFTAISTPDSITGTGASPITVSGLTAGTSYTFQVYGANASGTWSNVKSAASNSVTPYTTAFDSISTTTLSVDTATVTFSSIPGTYQHLQIRYLAKQSTSGSFGTSIDIRLNDVTATNYTRHNLYGNGAAVTSDGATALTSVRCLSIGCESSTANIFGIGIIDIHDYASSSKRKTITMSGGWDNNGSGVVGLNSGVLSSNTAVTSISIGIGNFSTNFKAGSTFALYGIKGA
jgi:hypothetical protein